MQHSDDSTTEAVASTDTTLHQPNMTCCICFEVLSGSGCQRLPCGHVLHEKCVREMRCFGAVGRCPLCRHASDLLTPIQDLIEQASACRVRDANVECAQLASEVLALDSTNEHANLLLGELYRSGQGVHKDPCKAFELLEQGRIQGNARCATQLGVLYGDFGMGNKAKELYEEGRRRGDSRGALNLGVCAMEEGQEQQAKEFFTEAVLGGDAGGYTYMGCLHDRAGEVSTAEFFYELGWLHGHVQALSYLGALRRDQGQVEEAVRLLELACQLGDPDAAVELCEIHKQG